MLRSAMLGLLNPPIRVDETIVRQRCLELPVDPPDDRLEGPHEGTLTSTRCVVRAYTQLPQGASASGWTVARYEWESIFSGEGSGPVAAHEEEVVVFEAGPGAVWHQRYEVGSSGVWRSVTPEVAAANQGRTLLSIMSCVNGTGGCSQEFLVQHPDGRWFPVEQRWLDQLPQGFVDRILHGVRIDPRTLTGEAGFYAATDANCCPSQTLVVDLALEQDALVLVRRRLRPAQ
jgi:hypothetical protein